MIRVKPVDEFEALSRLYDVLSWPCLKTLYVLVRRGGRLSRSELVRLAKVDDVPHKLVSSGLVRVVNGYVEMTERGRRIVEKLIELLGLVTK